MTRTPWKWAALAMAVVGCGVEPKDNGDTSGIKELDAPLTALAGCPASTGCTFASGALTVPIADTEIAVISKHPVSGAILVNDVASYTAAATPVLATATNVKTIAVTMAGTTSHVIILDFANGTFAPGTSTTPGITVAFGGGTSADAFKVRGSATTGDSIVAGVNNGGSHAFAFNTDAFADIVLSGLGSAVTYTFSLGGGNDTFNGDAAAAVAKLGTGSTAFPDSVTVYGGLGDDTFRGGLCDDVFYGDLGNDTFNAGAAMIAPAGSCTGYKTFSGGGGTDTADFSARGAAHGLVFTLDGVPANGATAAVAGAVADGEDTDADGIANDGEIDDIMNDVEVVKGGAGDDIFYSDSAATPVGHAFYGGNGNDTADYTATTVAIAVTMGDKIANDGISGQKDDIRDDVENLKCPTAAVACVVSGNALDNTFTPGGAGASVFNGGTGNDLIDFSAYTSAVNIVMDNTVSTSPGFKINTDMENVKCPTAVHACTVVGNAASNHIWAGGGVNTISSSGGDDFIEGLLATDVIDCGDGSDIFTTAVAPTVAALNCEL